MQDEDYILLGDLAMIKSRLQKKLDLINRAFAESQTKYPVIPEKARLKALVSEDRLAQDDFEVLSYCS